MGDAAVDAEAEKASGGGQAHDSAADSTPHPASAPSAPTKPVGDALADAGDDQAEEQVTGDGQIKVTQIDDVSSSDSIPHAPPSLNSATKPVAQSVPEVLKKGADAVRAAFAVLAASLVLRAVAAVFSKFTPARAAFLVSTLTALWWSAGEPCTSVWTFSVISISYLALWAVFFTRALHPLAIVVSLSYVMLLAISVTHLSSKLGVFLMLLDMAYAAGLFGYAVSEYRQRKGMDGSAKALQTRVKQEELKNDDAVITMVSFYATLASFFSAAGAAWVLLFTTDMYWVVVLLSLLIDMSLFWWVAFVGMHLLHGVLFADDHIAFIYWGTALLVVPDFLLSYLFGQSIGVLVHPVGVMGIAGVLGYSLGVYVCYKNISTK